VGWSDNDVDELWMLLDGVLGNDGLAVDVWSVWQVLADYGYLKDEFGAVGG